MSRANPLWGAPRIHGELQKLGIEIAQATVSKYLVRHRTPPSQTWRTLLDNHLQTLVSVDFFVVPTVLFKVLFDARSGRPTFVVASGWAGCRDTSTARPEHGNESRPVGSLVLRQDRVSGPA